MVERCYGTERIWSLCQEKEGEERKERKEGKEEEVECRPAVNEILSACIFFCSKMLKFFMYFNCYLYKIMIR